MGLAIRYSDTVVDLSPLPGFSVRRETRSDVMARLQNRPAALIEARFAAGHSAWTAFINDEPAAWGWVAARSAEIGELGLTFRIPPRERYLWNFVTLPSFRGRGIYPRLLDAIVRGESGSADRFWIAYAPENRASATGIGRAGFEPVAELSFDRSGVPAVAGAGAGTEAAAVLFGVPRRSGSLTPCWRCVRAGVPAESACTDGECACDYQAMDIPCG